MDDLQFLKATVPQFEGYDSEEARHHSDQRVRAWVGSTLADVQVTLSGSLDPTVETSLEDAILRCQFPDQTYTVRMDGVTDVTPELVQSLAQVDRRLVELATRAAQAEAAELKPVLDDIFTAFEQRRQRAPAPQPFV
jgi:hypothetical protein